MKPAQWTAVLVLALMVGGITFVSVYLGGGGRDDTDAPAVDLPTLNFPIKAFPQKHEPPLVTEVRQDGHQDFWFSNDSGQDLAVGLNAKGCTCSEVEIAVAPPSWRAYGDRLNATKVLQPPLHGLDGLTMMAALNWRERLFLESLTGEANHAMLTKDKENSFTVPADAIGRVRLSWNQQAARVLNTYADLWIGKHGGTVNSRLDARVLIADPVVLANKKLALPVVTTRHLENLENKKKNEHGWIVCGSMTRLRFHVQAELVHERVKAESDPVEVGEPVPLNAEDLRKLAKEFEDQMPTILSGFKIPVTLKARAKDGTPIEWGHFTRFVRMTAEESGEPVLVEVTGQVLGDVTVGEMGKVRGSLDLGPFPRERGTHGNLILQTDEKNLELEVDASRQPEYLKASLSKPEVTTAGHRLWKLRVEVPRGVARGEFPSDDNPLYRDSAVYVKTKGKPPQSIRIPVTGTAIFR